MLDRRGATTAVVVVSAGWLSAPALAQEQEAASDRSQSFRAVEGAVKEDIPGGPLMLASYGLIWVLLLLYVLRLVRQQQRTQADVQRLEAQLAKSAPEQE